MNGDGSISLSQQLPQRKKFIQGTMVDFVPFYNIHLWKQCKLVDGGENVETSTGVH